MSFLDRLASVEGRLVTGIAFASSSASAFWNGHEGDLDLSKLAACILTGLGWLLAELASGRSVSERDVALFQAFQAEFTPRSFEFLRDHDFHASYLGQAQKSIFNIANWQGTRYEFVDSKVQSEWIKVHSAFKSFSNTLALNTFPVHHLDEVFTVHATESDPEDPPPFVQARIDKLNAGATELADAVQNFERIAVRRLKL